MRQFSIIIGLLIYYLTGFSQIVDFKNDEYWIDAGVGGFTTFNKISGGTWNISVNLFNNSTFYEIRFSRNEELGDYFFGPVPSEVYNNISFMIGKGLSKKYFQLQFLGGLGITGGIKRGEYINFLGSTEYYEKDQFITPSIPLAIDFLLKPIKYAGIGITLFGDVNLSRSYFGIAFKLSIGKLR